MNGSAKTTRAAWPRSLWPIEARGLRHDTDRGRTIADHLGASGDLLASLRAVFPRELAAELVEDLDAAGTADIRINYRGDMIVGGRMFVGGKAVSNERNSSLLAFKRELAGLGKSVEKLAKQIDAAEAKCDAGPQGADRYGRKDGRSSVVDN